MNFVLSCVFICSYVHRYIDPTYIRTGILSPASDIYAIGVVMYELLSSLKPVTSVNTDDSTIKSKQLLVNVFSNKMLDTDSDCTSLFDTQHAKWSKSAAKEIAKIAGDCVHRHAHRRPSARYICHTLETICDKYDCIALFPKATKKAVCVICQENEPAYAACPCGHKCICENCLEIVKKYNGNGICPICRKTVTSFMRIYD